MVKDMISEEYDIDGWGGGSAADADSAANG